MNLTTDYFNAARMNEMSSINNILTPDNTVSNMTAQGDGNPLCPICLEGLFGPYNVTMLHKGDYSLMRPSERPGKHFFHNKCLRDYRSSNPVFGTRCPSCRTPALVAEDISFSPIAHAIEAGREEQAIELIANGVDPNVHHLGKGMAAIHIAAKNGNLELIRSLLDCGADIDLQDKKGMTPLHHAVSYGDVQVLKIFLDCKADMNLQNKYGCTALHLAAKAPENPELFDTLIDNGASFDKTDNDGPIVMHLAAESGHERALKKLIAKHADVNVVDEDERTPLILATYGSSAIKEPLKKNAPELARILLSAGARIDLHPEIGYSAFDAIGQWNNPLHIELLKELLPAGMTAFADVNQPVCSRRRTLLFYALLAKDKEAVQKLIARGAKVDARSIGNINFYSLLDRLGEQKQAFVEILNQAGSHQSKDGE
ncbi:ankyrin repeat domain-containing protein [Endozoicomonas sp. SESOKO2]|uniref:ankyrin repeat domain-containing protein n=1 Tax=Endozoicomonas sp. SESOKO2 TaxID=2828743 RepID=UPI00214936F2|nr:ankyrin repeat domain-containing protein [Endozoicomonas sp. SESOKO2]